MKRRNFNATAVTTLFTPIVWARRPAPPPASVPIDAIAKIKALRITSGPMTSGYRIAPGGILNWYFIQLGLLPMVQYLSAADLDTYIRQYMDLYLRRLESNNTIQDVHFNDASAQTFTVVPSDSDNSYAATLLSLAARYLKATNNWTWWDANKAKLKAIAYANIIMLIKPSGLARVFQYTRLSPVADFGYMMNNAEDYRGLKDFASVLRLRGESAEADYYSNFATTIGRSMGLYLWDSGRSAFKTSDQDSRADPSTFYPGTTCQVFPQAFDVAEMSPYFTSAYNFLNTYSPSWPNEVYDPFPWAILGYVAAKRGDLTRARTQMTATQKKYVADPGLVTINELGFYQRTQSLLNGYGDI